MSKANLLSINLIALILVFLVKSSGFSTGPCPPDCPGPTSTIPGRVNCNSNWRPLWDYGKTESDTIGVNENITIAVQWGRPPYTWTLYNTSDQGRGFSLAEKTTMGPTNTLSTNSTPCGTAWIKVTDTCGNEVFETIRHSNVTSGSWISIAHNECVLAERWTEAYPGSMPRYTYQYGGRYQEQVLTKGPGQWGYCPGDETCGDFVTQPHQTVDCLQTERLPCKQWYSPLMYECIITYSMSYREWECTF
jgi:hypothetical protein